MCSREFRLDLTMNLNITSDDKQQRRPGHDPDDFGYIWVYKRNRILKMEGGADCYGSVMAADGWFTRRVAVLGTAVPKPPGGYGMVEGMSWFSRCTLHDAVGLSTSTERYDLLYDFVFECVDTTNGNVLLPER